VAESARNRNGNSHSASVDPDEVAKFAALAGEWWDPAGKFAPLHRLNPARLTFIRDRIAAHKDRDPLAERPLAGIRVLDIGCGGGLLCEPLARLGAQVTGIDAAERNVAVAADHAAEAGLDIDYRHTTAEALAAEALAAEVLAAEARAAEALAGNGAGFDLVLNMEVVEHVADVAAFLQASAALVAANGAMALATLNRTPKSFALAIVGAEYVLRWLPRGTHDWRRFLRPSELVAYLRAAGLETRELTGVAYNPLTGAWRLAPRDLDVNYMVFAVKE
jgi:2-polyprenyl-6-hydroxyphenyl methylase/3-demethylubiquinone-9 3-methyltransferase